MEIQQGHIPGVPFYRLRITERSRSAQHDLLLDLDTSGNEVFYAAPRFHKVEELNAAYLASEVALRSFYVRPRDIGKLDDGSHHIAFDNIRCHLFSEHRELKGVPGEAFASTLRARRFSDDRPFGAGPLNKVLEGMERLLHEWKLPTDIPDQGRHEKSDAERKLRRMADFSLRYFGAQLFIVQDAVPSDGGSTP